MKKLISAFFLSALLIPCAPVPKKPKLVVAIVVDQFRYDYLNRFRSYYTGGFARMLERGAVFTNAHYEHFPTVTAVGHSTILSGATPSISGIVGNEWYDRESGKQVTSVSDDTEAGSGLTDTSAKLTITEPAYTVTYSGINLIAEDAFGREIWTTRSGN